MKKLMMAAAIVCAAVGVQAASVDWIYSDYTEDGDYIGATVYAIAGSVQSEWASVAAIQAAAMTTGGSAEIEDGGRSYDTGMVTGADATLTKASGETPASGYYFVIVSADGTMYGVSAAGDNSYVYDPDAQESSPGAFEIDSDTFVPNKKFSEEPIPEPTSAMLILLGVAGLALKRKQK